MFVGQDGLKAGAVLLAQRLDLGLLVFTQAELVAQGGATAARGLAFFEYCELFVGQDGLKAGAVLVFGEPLLLEGLNLGLLVFAQAERVLALFEDGALLVGQDGLKAGVVLFAEGLDLGLLVFAQAERIALDGPAAFGVPVEPTLAAPAFCRGVHGGRGYQKHCGCDGPCCLHDASPCMR